MAKNRENPVVLSRIYTRTGDEGTTALGDASRTRKTDPRLAAYADVEEANAAIGVALALGSLPEDVAALLLRVQNELFDVGADLCAPVVPDPEYPPLRIEASYIERLEAACDEQNAKLRPLRSFILPGGTPGGALLHVARTVARRAERTAWAAVEAHGAAAVDDPEAVAGGVNPLAVKYLNRLSDLLFILCRVANLDHGDVLWKPGGER
ncbi:cob(I)yrinic acid a,c-diamide adenosyltransferase [Actinomadura sediminis]|uniref:Corrinoid adenosyltransferase n=1 Tax=Actinomadura sediminis TaxID=1038904 RepID=A0ABW3EL46_9ACTN